MSIGDRFASFRDDVRARAERLADRLGTDRPTALAHFIRPNLGPTPQPLRRILEPIVAAAALLALFVLGGAGMFTLAAFFVLAILCGVFGGYLCCCCPGRIDSIKKTLGLDDDAPSSAASADNVQKMPWDAGPNAPAVLQSLQMQPISVGPSVTSRHGSLGYNEQNERGRSSQMKLREEKMN